MRKTLIERLENPQRIDGGMLDTKLAEAAMREAATVLRGVEWRGCTHLDCLPECTVTSDGGHCERFARFEAARR